LEGSQKGKDFVFAAARVRSVEKSLMGRERLEALADSRKPADAMKLLYEQGYGDDNGEQLKPEQFEKLLMNELKRAYSFILGIAPAAEDFNTFLYPYDYHNIKVLMKAEFLQTDRDEFLIDAGTIAEDKLSAMIRDRDLAGLTPAMRTAVNEVLDVFARTQDPQYIDLILDKACFSDMKAAALESGSKFLQGYAALLIDTVNLKIFARLRQMRKPWDFCSQVLIDGGRIPEKVFFAGYDEPYEQFAERLVPYGLKAAMETGGAMLREKGRFTDLERLCDNSIMEYAAEAKYVSFGIEPLAAYLIAKESEIRNVRIAMTGILQGLPRDVVAERLRDTYV